MTFAEYFSTATDEQLRQDYAAFCSESEAQPDAQVLALLATTRALFLTALHSVGKQALLNEDCGRMERSIA